MGEIIFTQDSLVMSSELYIINTIKTLNELENRKKKIMAELYEEMEKRGIKSIENENRDLLITLVLPTTRETMDTKKFREENPDLYDKYCRISNVKGTVKITIREKNDGVDNQ